MTLTQRKQLEHRRIARAFASDHQRETMSERRTGSIALGSAILITLAMALVVAALWGVGVL